MNCVISDNIDQFVPDILHAPDRVEPLFSIVFARIFVDLDAVLLIEHARHAQEIDPPLLPNFLALGLIIGESHWLVFR